MVKIKAIADTILKKEPRQSSQLEPHQISSVAIGREFTGNKIGQDGQHSRYELDFGAGSWWVYDPHWQVETDTFPSGLPKPQIGDRPTKTDVIESIINYCLTVGITNSKHIAYVLSTAENESQFKAIKEYRGRTLTSDQQRYWGSNFMGRGFIQVTWKSNYIKVGQKLGIDLVNNPDLLLTYPVAITSLVLGMRDGWYTGRKLTNYKPGDYWNQRAIVNPGEIKYRRYWDRATKFVDSALKWEIYLKKYAGLYIGIKV